MMASETRDIADYTISLWLAIFFDEVGKPVLADLFKAYMMSLQSEAISA